MRTINRTFVASPPVLALSMSACGSSNEPKDIQDLSKEIETAGYTCQEPYNDPDYPDHTELHCGENVGVIWIDTAAAEVKSFENSASVYKKIGPLPFGTWRHLDRPWS